MMTEAELWHMHLLAVENTTVSLDGVATIIFAYLATACFVGGKLSRSQAVLASLIPASVYFMHDVRRSARAPESTGSHSLTER